MEALQRAEDLGYNPINTLKAMHLVPTTLKSVRDFGIKKAYNELSDKDKRMFIVYGDRVKASLRDRPVKEIHNFIIHDKAKHSRGEEMGIDVVNAVLNDKPLLLNNRTIQSN